MRNFASLVGSIGFLLLLPSASEALTISSGPVFTPATNAPLAGVLKVTTDVDARLSVSVDDGIQTWTREFYTFARVQSAPLAGFRPGRTNQITVTVHDLHGNTATVAQPVIFVSPALPADFPRLALLKSQPNRIEPGYTLFRVAIGGGIKGYNVIVDNSGQVVWYSSALSGLDVRQLDNGDLFMFSNTNFVEMNLLGETVKTWQVPANLLIDNHDGLVTDHGTILYISTASAVVTNIPPARAIPPPPRARHPMSFTAGSSSFPPPIRRRSINGR